MMERARLHWQENGVWVVHAQCNGQKGWPNCCRFTGWPRELPGSGPEEHARVHGPYGGGVSGAARLSGVATPIQIKSPTARLAGLKSRAGRFKEKRQRRHKTDIRCCEGTAASNRARSRATEAAHPNPKRAQCLRLGCRDWGPNSPSGPGCAVEDGRGVRRFPARGT
jgi:hypothetical protein